MPQHDGARLAPPAGRLLSSRKDERLTAEEAPGPVPFERFNRALARYSASYRCQVDAHGSEVSAGEWRLLRLEADDALEVANQYDPLDYPPTRHQPTRRSTAATATKPGAVALSEDDPLKRIEPRVYVEALTGETVPDN